MASRPANADPLSQAPATLPPGRGEVGRGVECRASHGRLSPTQAFNPHPTPPPARGREERPKGSRPWQLPAFLLPPGRGEVGRGVESRARYRRLSPTLALNPHPNPPPARGREVRPKGSRPWQVPAFPLPPGRGEVGRGVECRAPHGRLSPTQAFNPHPTPPPARGRRKDPRGADVANAGLLLPPGRGEVGRGVECRASHGRLSPTWRSTPTPTLPLPGGGRKDPRGADRGKCRPFSSPRAGGRLGGGSNVALGTDA